MINRQRARGEVNRGGDEEETFVSHYKHSYYCIRFVSNPIAMFGCVINNWRMPTLFAEFIVLLDYHSEFRPKNYNKFRLMLADGNREMMKTL